MASVPISIPRAGQAMVDGSIRQWLVDNGAPVAEGQPLYVLETDKVEMEVPAPVSGVLSISVQVGGPYEVGTEIGVIETV